MNCWLKTKGWVRVRAEILDSRFLDPKVCFLWGGVGRVLLFAFSLSNLFIPFPKGHLVKCIGKTERGDS